MKPGIDPKSLEALWKSPQSWKWGVYYCKNDPRVIVPKRLKWMGWTINFARPSAWPTLLAMLLFLAIPIFLMSANGLVNTPFWFAIVVAEVFALCLICWFMASKKQY